MIEYESVNHHIQKSIIDVLMYTEIARFRDLRPPRVDTNLFTYHLNVLLKQGMIEKAPGGGYQLGQKGLAYVDRVSAQKKALRTQPKIVTMLLVQNSNGDVLLQKRTKQPYINTWTLPYGKLHIDDESVVEAAQREAFEKLGLQDQPLRHVGDCYIRVTSGGSIVSSTVVHVCAFNRDDIATNDGLVWARPHKLGEYRLAPAVEQIVARGFFNDPFFFEEFTVDWPTSLEASAVN